MLERLRCFLEADDRLLSDFAEAMGPTVTGIENAVMEGLERGVPAPRSARQPRFRGRRLRLVAAAVIACGVLTLVGHLLLSLGKSTVTLAETLEAMHKTPWIHVVQQRSADDGDVYEYWECFDARTRARKMPGGKMVYANYAENVVYAYNPNANKITVSFATDTYMIGSQWNPLEMLGQAVSRTEETAVHITRTVGVEGERRVECIIVGYDDDSQVRSVIYVRDVERNLLIRTAATTVRNGRPERYTTAFDYPEEGPRDIYALGAPKDAIVVDIRPEGPALVLVDRVQERFEQGLGDYVAVVLESERDAGGMYRPSQIAVLRQKGELKRSDIYCAFDFQDRPDAPGTLYARIKDDWPNLTVHQVIEMADAEALDQRMLFEGQQTIRWRRDGGQMVRDEHRSDLFKISRGPLPDSLTSLTWPNLHLRLQSGSSHFKREVRLLPEDANRPGLVGLQFVEFAEREDYWFDPGKDYMRVERIRKQEGRGTVSRLLVAQAARTPEGRWYPHVIQTESSHADGTIGSRRELRVLFDASPAFDDDLFRSETLTATGASKPRAAEQQNDAPVETAEPGSGPMGWVRDQQGKPIAQATVLLYHKRSRWGLGNEVVERVYHKRSRWGLGNEVVERVQTGADGRYTLAAPLDFERVRQHAYAQDFYVLLALHADYAVAWQNIEQGQSKREYGLTLTAPTVRTILVTDHDGNPLPGVRVWLYSAGDRKSASLALQRGRQEEFQSSLS